MGPAGWSYFRLIGISVVDIGLDGADSLAIGGAILIGADVAVGFFGLSL